MYIKSKVPVLGCCSWVLRRSLTSQIISVAFYIECEKSYKFCLEPWFRLEVLLRAVSLRHILHGFSSLPKKVILKIFTLWKKNPSSPAGFEPANLGSSGEYDNLCTTRVDSIIRPSIIVGLYGYTDHFTKSSVNYSHDEIFL